MSLPDERLGDVESVIEAGLVFFSTTDQLTYNTCFPFPEDTSRDCF